MKAMTSKYRNKRHRKKMAKKLIENENNQHGERRKRAIVCINWRRKANNGLSALPRWQTFAASWRRHGGAHARNEGEKAITSAMKMAIRNEEKYEEMYEIVCISNINQAK